MIRKAFSNIDIFLKRAHVGTREWPDNNFWHNIRLEDSPLIQIINPNMESFIDKQTRVSDFITTIKQLEDALINIIPEGIINNSNQSQSLYKHGW